MNLTIKKQILILGAFAISGLTACSSGKEDDSSLEMKEPVEAAPAASATADAAAASSVVVAKEETAVATPAPAAKVAPVPSSGAGQVMNTSRRVMYVKVNGAVMRERAEPKAKVVGKLEKGDHLLVSIEGDWAKTDDGKFISVKVLSEKGVGRVKKGATWSGGVKQDPTAKNSVPLKTEATTNAPVTQDAKKPAKADEAKPEAVSGDENPQQ